MKKSFLFYSHKIDSSSHKASQSASSFSIPFLFSIIFFSEKARYGDGESTYTAMRFYKWFAGWVLFGLQLPKLRCHPYRTRLCSNVLYKEQEPKDTSEAQGLSFVFSVLYILFLEMMTNVLKMLYLIIFSSPLLL